MDICPSCRTPGEEFDWVEVAFDPIAAECPECGVRLRAEQLLGTAIPDAAHAATCSRQLLPAYEYPEVPTMSEEAALLLEVEGRLPRDESGTLLPSEMHFWLRQHGVRDAAERLLWEDLLVTVSRIKSRLQAEALDAASSAKSSRSDED
jgi:hypothetical protein